jgi:hypothetical protein
MCCRQTHWTVDHPDAEPQPTQNKSRQTSISRVGFEPTIPVLERTKTFHSLDCATAVIHCNLLSYAYLVGTQWRGWLKYYAISRKVAGRF